MKSCKNFLQKKRLGEDEGKEEGREPSGKGKKFTDFSSLLISNWSIYKEKKRSQRLFLTLGEITK